MFNFQDGLVLGAVIVFVVLWCHFMFPERSYMVLADGDSGIYMTVQP